MNRCKGDMVSPRPLLALLAAFSCLAYTCGGPLGPLPNVTSLGLKEGSCAVGDVVYLQGDEFPGASPCERCTCGSRGVNCTQTQCEPRPGCKALHRPDHCCPTYQCECEQEGRVYGNGEKLVDPHDPCRVCYCQGGEVVCRRIACFVRDDCSPRLVPGRCCPEYDDCPLRGVTSLPGMTPAPSVSTVQAIEPSAAPSPPKEIKQEITIKEITPVSEIPIITDVKIKEILPSPSIEVAEYSSSKSPLIPREATSEKPVVLEKTRVEPDSPSVIEINSAAEPAPMESSRTKDDSQDTPPSKISLSTQDSIINSDIYPSNVPSVAMMGVPPVPSAPVSVVVPTKAPVMEEEDTSFLDHNPAFPPLPDDLSVLSNHGDELVPEPTAETDHMPVENVATPEVIVASVTPASDDEAKELLTTFTPTTEKLSEFTTETSTTIRSETTTEVPVVIVKESATLNLRSPIPTAILSAPSEETNGDDLSTSASTLTDTTEIPKSVEIFSTEDTVKPKKAEDITTEQALPDSTKLVETSTENVQSDAPRTSEEFTTDDPEAPLERVSFVPSSSDFDFGSTTHGPESEASATGSDAIPQEQTTNSIAKSNVATEVTSQTELSSLPIETSDQNPHEASENISKATLETSTVDSPTTSGIEKTVQSSPEVITVSKSNEKGDNIETTEFVLTPFVSSEESTTDVELLIKVAGVSDMSKSAVTNQSAAIVDIDTNKNALTDLIKLVSDVASISDHTDAPVTARPVLTTTISDSEELIPVNAGYKSKNSNFNQNSITEVPFKSKSAPPANKQKIIEIEDDDTDGITDAAPPDDKVEPTTRRPIIDNVSDDMPVDTKTDKKDIEIITQSYVPTIHKRPTKVVLQETPQEAAPPSTPDPDNTPGSESTLTPDSSPIRDTTPAPDSTPVPESTPNPSSGYASVTSPIPTSTPAPESTRAPESTPFLPASTPDPENTPVAAVTSHEATTETAAPADTTIAPQ